jgi:hypothetical protein
MASRLRMVGLDEKRESTSTWAFRSGGSAVRSVKMPTTCVLVVGIDLQDRIWAQFVQRERDHRVVEHDDVDTRVGTLTHLDDQALASRFAGFIRDRRQRDPAFGAHRGDRGCGDGRVEAHRRIRNKRRLNTFGARLRPIDADDVLLNRQQGSQDGGEKAEQPRHDGEKTDSSELDCFGWHAADGIGGSDRAPVQTLSCRYVPARWWVALRANTGGVSQCQHCSEQRISPAS